MVFPQSRLKLKITFLHPHRAVHPQITAGVSFLPDSVDRLIRSLQDQQPVSWFRGCRRHWMPVGGCWGPEGCAWPFPAAFPHHYTIEHGRGHQCEGRQCAPPPRQEPWPRPSHIRSGARCDPSGTGDADAPQVYRFVSILLISSPRVGAPDVPCVLMFYHPGCRGGMLSFAPLWGTALFLQSKALVPRDCWSSKGRGLFLYSPSWFHIISLGGPLWNIILII